MLTHTFRMPRLLSHYYILYDPPNSSGDEALRFISETRKIKLRGHSFREFQQHVIPLLDGKHTIQEIEEKVSDLFAPEDLEASIMLLAEQNLIEDAAGTVVEPGMAEILAPQLAFFHDVSPEPERMQHRLAAATVTVLGLGGAGASAAISLAAVQVGFLRCVDSLPVAPADCYLAPVYTGADVGVPRADAVARKLLGVASKTETIANSRPLETDDDVLAAVEGSDFIICCADPAQASLIYKLNRVCLKTGIPWTSCSTAALEVVLGPTVDPGKTACFLCYKMRMVACSEDPEDEFAFQSFLDRRKSDDSGRRENLVFHAGFVGNLLGLEALKWITGIGIPAACGKIIVFDMLDFSMKKHAVLRKPWCPACFSNPKPEQA